MERQPMPTNELLLSHKMELEGRLHALLTKKQDLQQQLTFIEANIDATQERITDIRITLDNFWSPNPDETTKPQ